MAAQEQVVGLAAVSDQSAPYPKAVELAQPWKHLRTLHRLLIWAEAATVGLALALWLLAMSMGLPVPLVMVTVLVPALILEASVHLTLLSLGGAYFAYRISQAAPWSQGEADLIQTGQVLWKL